MAEVTRISIEAPGLRSSKQAQMQPIIPAGYSLADIPEGQRVFRRVDQSEARIFIKKGRQPNEFTGYRDYASALRAIDHILTRDQRENVQIKYRALAIQIQTLQSERRSLELAEADLAQLAVDARTVAGERRRIVANATQIVTEHNLQTKPSQLNDTLPAELLQAQQETQSKLDLIPAPTRPGWAIIPSATYEDTLSLLSV